MGKYTEFYKKRHETGYGRTGHKHVKTVADQIKGHGVETVLDWGAGSRTLSKALAEHRPDWAVTAYDPCVPGLDVLPEGTFDAVVSTDVLEHIPYEELDEAIQQILSLTGKVGYHHIASYPARETFPDGRNIHVVLEKADWWKARFEANGANVIRAVDNPIVATNGKLRYAYACITILKEPALGNP